MKKKIKTLFEASSQNAEIEWLQIQIFYYDQKHYLHILMVTKYMINMTVQLFKGLIMQQGHNTVRKSQ